MNNAITRMIAAALALILCGALEAAQAAILPQESSSAAQTQSPSSATQEASPQNPVSSAVTKEGDKQDLPDSPGAAQSSNQKRNQENVNTQEPQGTAAAEAAKTRGGAASKPAGAAIAPAKQRRTRSLLIKLGIIAGAGAALGTVYALAKGSPSRPPGAQ